MIFKKRKFYEKFIKFECKHTRVFPMFRSRDQSNRYQHVTFPCDAHTICIKKTPKFTTRAEIFSAFSTHAEIFFSKKTTLFSKRKKLQKYHLWDVHVFSKNEKVKNECQKNAFFCKLRKFV